MWPKADVELSFVEGARIAQIVESKTQGTSSITYLKPLIQLPVFASRAETSSCIDDLAVGVDVTGSLLINNDALRYLSTPRTTLIGYARDGFPIYGFYEEINKLDECGGIDEGDGYRYHLRKDDPDILKCFAGTPAKFVSN